MLRIQRRQSEMNHQVLQDSIGLKREVKILLGAIGKGKEGGFMMDIHPSDPLRNGPGMKTQKKLSK